MAETTKTLVQDDADRLMSIKEVSERLGCSLAFTRNLFDTGLLTAIRFGAKVRRVRKVTFNDFLKQYDGCNLYDLVKEKVS